MGESDKVYLLGRLAAEVAFLRGDIQKQSRLLARQRGSLDVIENFMSRLASDGAVTVEATGPKHTVTANTESASADPVQMDIRKVVKSSLPDLSEYQVILFHGPDITLARFLSTCVSGFTNTPVIDIEFSGDASYWPSVSSSGGTLGLSKKYKEMYDDTRMPVHIVASDDACVDDCIADVTVSVVNQSGRVHWTVLQYPAGKPVSGFLEFGP